MSLTSFRSRGGAARRRAGASFRSTRGAQRPPHGRLWWSTTPLAGVLLAAAVRGGGAAVRDRGREKAGGGVSKTADRRGMALVVTRAFVSPSRGAPSSRATQVAAAADRSFWLQRRRAEPLPPPPSSSLVPTRVTRRATSFFGGTLLLFASPTTSSAQQKRPITTMSTTQAPADGPFSLPPLPWDKGALEPYTSARTVEARSAASTSLPGLQSFP